MIGIRETDKLKLYEIEELIGYKFNDITHLYQALIHKSYVNESPDLPLDDNERYEFMGDAVLEFVATKYLFERYPDKSEGELTLMRSRIVDRDNCARIGRDFRLMDFIFLGRGEKLQGRGMKRSILANAFEALVCAIYLDGGMKKAAEFVISAMERFSPGIETNASRNYKAELQNYVQRKYQKIPSYRDIGAVGPDHEKTFKVSVTINNREYGTGQGPSKKIAQQTAAKQALQRIQEEEETGNGI